MNKVLPGSLFLDFIKDEELKKIITKSLDYSIILINSLQLDQQKNNFIEETCRVIILYIQSIIEAVLLYFYNIHSDNIMMIEYIEIQKLPSSYTKNDQYIPVIAMQKQKQRSQPGFQELVQFFKDRKNMTLETSNKMLKLNQIRNTFHLNKSRESLVCDEKQVNESFELLMITLSKGPERLKN